MRGLAVGLVKAPIHWGWGAAYDASPDGRFTRFVSGFARALGRYTERSKKAFFDPLVQQMGIVRAMDGAKYIGTREEWTGEPYDYHRPTLGAALAFLAARFLQVAWLLGIVLVNVIPFVPLYALYEGVQNARGEKQKPGPYDGWRPDPDRPGSRN